MRNAALTLILVVFAYTTNAQFTFLPQAGIENPLSKISYNDLPAFDPLKSIQPQVGFRAEYKFKSGFGPYVGISTSRSGISYNFSNPETGMSIYQASAAKMQLQLAGGLQYTSKPISLGGNNSTQATTSKTSSSKANCSSKSESSSSSGCGSKVTVTKTGCGSKTTYTKPGCGSKSSYASKTKTQKLGWTMRIQPSLGLAYMPSDQPELVSKSSGYTYNAGQVKTAIVPAVGFEFARNKSRLFTLRVGYYQGLGENETSFTSMSANKTVTTSLSSKVSGWNVSIGFPISFTRKPATKTYTEKKKSSCQPQQYRNRCGDKKIYKF